VDFRILGPLEVLDDEGRRLDLGAPRQRAVLAVLVVFVNQVVSVDRLIDELWGETPPSAATASLQAYVSNLRRVLEPQRRPRAPAQVVVTEAPGYALRLAADQIDAVRFERLATDAHRALSAGDALGALHSLDAAIGLWRGGALAEFAYEPFAASAIARLEELRVVAEEDRVESQMTVGDTTRALAALGPLIAAHPLRERLRALKIRVLYRCGRQAEALRAYDEARRLLVDEIGLEPGHDLQVLHQQVLAQDPALDDLPAGGPPPRAASTPVPAAVVRRARSVFIGREDALARLRGAMDDAAAGQTRIVLLQGEPGIGKTRLAFELAAVAEGRGVSIAWGRCHDDEGAPPLWPWMQVLRALGVTSATLPPHSRPVLAALLPELGPASSDEIAPDAARFRLYDAVREAIEGRLADRAALVILDDVHWADASSLRLLQFLATELCDVRVLVLVTFRDTDRATTAALADAVADLARQPDAERLALTGLSEGDVADLVRTTTSVSDDEVAAIAGDLHQRTSGNPFFITELVRLMESEGRLRTAGGRVDVPHVIGDVIRKRVNRLPDDTQTVLSVAAVIGRRFELDILAHACGLDPERTLEALEAAVIARIVAEDGPSRYRFSHALVSETLHGDLAPARRERLHGRVAEAIEATFDADLAARYHELAHHYANATASASAQALDYARRAAEQARDRLAYDEVVVHLRGALGLLDRTKAVTPAVRARLLLELAAAERSAGHLAAGSVVNDQALAVARRTDDPSLRADAALAFGEVGLWQVRRYGTVDEHVVTVLEDALRRLEPGDSMLRARLLTGLAVALYYSEGERRRSLTLVRDGVSMARRLGDIGLLVSGLVELIVMLDGAPDDSDQLAAASELAALAPGDAPRETASAVVLRLARIALARGDSTYLARDVHAFARRAEAARQPDDKLWVTWALTTLAFLDDRFDEAERLAAEAFALHQRLGIWGAEESFATHMVLIWREQHRMEAVADVVKPLLANSVHPSAAKLLGVFALEMGSPEDIHSLVASDPVPRSRDFTWLADMCITAELASAADLPCRHELYDLLLPFQDRVVTMDATFICMGAVSYYLGLLAASLDRHDEALRHLDRAIELDDAIGARPWSRRARHRRELLLRDHQRHPRPHAPTR
jgi:DNA-binding SARP family transcriptional activator